ncbi:MAG: universal stress protein [Kofleriaceae bacterium]|nr:universal stress protein [Kofleriaceae bacterium]
MEHCQVVVGFDFSHSSHAALERAIALATRAPWHVLHVVAAIDPRMAFPAVPASHVDAAYAERVEAAIHALVDQELDDQLVRDRVRYSVHARIGKPVKEILGVASDVGADLILVGTKGLTGLERAMVGSTAERIVREAGCTVEVVRPKTYAYVPLLEVIDAPAV